MDPACIIVLSANAAKGQHTTLPYSNFSKSIIIVKLLKNPELCIKFSVSLSWLINIYIWDSCLEMLHLVKCNGSNFYTMIKVWYHIRKRAANVSWVLRRVISSCHYHSACQKRSCLSVSSSFWQNVYVLCHVVMLIQMHLKGSQQFYQKATISCVDVAWRAVISLSQCHLAVLLCSLTAQDAIQQIRTTVTPQGKQPCSMSWINCRIYDAALVKVCQNIILVDDMCVWNVLQV